MYHDRFGTNWERLSVDEAIRRAFALGAANGLGERVAGEIDRLRRVAETPADRRMVELAFDEGRARAQGRRGDGESTWEAVVSGDHEFATELTPPAQPPREERVPRGVPEAVGKLPMLDEPSDGLDRHRLPKMLDRRSKREDRDDRDDRDERRSHPTEREKWTARRETPMYDGVIFDNDGVLVPVCSFDVFREAAHRTFDSFGVDPTDQQVVDVASVADPDRVCEICTTHGLEPDTFWARRDRNNHLAQRREVAAGRKTPYDDTGVALSLDVPTGIVSSNQHETIEFLVDRFGWEFGTHYGREHTLAGVERKKPNTHYVDRAMADLGVSNPLFVGDSASDVQVAENAGLDSVFLRREHRADYDLPVEPTYELESLVGLHSLLD